MVMTPQKSELNREMGAPRLTRKEAIERFWNQVEKAAKNECWEWTGSLTTKGYGQYQSAALGEFTAHRTSYKLARGDIPSGKLVCHKCDNKKCVNPDHLFVGTVQDNSDDMVKKNRQSRGEEHGLSKLTEADVVRIRREALTVSDKRRLRSEIGIHKTTLNRVLNRQLWAHVP